MNFRQLSFHYKYFFDTLLHTITCPLVKGMFYLITLKSPLLSQNAYKNNMVYAITFLIGIFGIVKRFYFYKDFDKIYTLDVHLFYKWFLRKVTYTKERIRQR